ncbi:MAG: SulP family inorganic anion transporter [Acidimicrobiia bacterium]|nr:SulP family inorganic anion transporter [Acidimicrobiia bacterium]
MSGSLRAMLAPPRPSTRDVIAGISVALILIPQSLAYAEIAGVPSYIGLYAAALPPLAAAIVASSPYLQTGPVAMTALLTFGVISPLAVPGSAEFVALAALLALMVGAVRVLFGLLRSGVIAFFMSQPVLLGFTSGAAILITSSQIPGALGVSPGDGGLLGEAARALLNPGDWDFAAIGLAVLTGVIVLGGRRLSRVFPGVLVAVVVGLAWSIGAGYEGVVVGDIPAGLPPFSLDLPWSETGALLVGAVVIALVGFAEPAAIARTFAAQDRTIWNPNQEFISQGLANLAAGVSGGFPVGGSFSRSSVNKLAGGRTRWSGAITGLAVLAFLPVAGVLSDLPRAVLSAIVIVAVVPLIRVDQIWGIWPISRPQAAVAGVTFVATLAFSPRIDVAVLFGIGLGVAVHLARELGASVASSYVGNTLTVRPIGVLYFGSTPAMERILLEQLALNPEAERLEINLEQLGRIDFTGATVLQAFVADAKHAGLDVCVVSVPAHAVRIIKSVFADDDICAEI